MTSKAATRLVNTMAILGGMAAIALGAFGVADYAKQSRHRRELAIKRSDSYLRTRVVMLQGDRGRCSAVQVKAPSGKVYTLSAAHCRDIVSKGNIIEGVMDDGQVFKLEVLEVSRKDDLMLLTSGTPHSIDIAKILEKHTKIHTMTHGRGLPSHRSDGELLLEQTVRLPMYSIDTDAKMVQCLADGNEPTFIMFSEYPECVSNLLVMLSTAKVRPGSSGGAAVNTNNELIGIVSISDGDSISGLVPLRIIQEFMHKR